MGHLDDMDFVSRGMLSTNDFYFMQPIRQSRFRDTHMPTRGRCVVDLVSMMGSEWQNVTWLAPPAAVLTGVNWRKFAEDNGMEDGDLCVLELDPSMGHNQYISCNQSPRFKLKIKVHVLRMAATPWRRHDAASNPAIASTSMYMDQRRLDRCPELVGYS